MKNIIILFFTCFLFYSCDSSDESSLRVTEDVPALFNKVSPEQSGVLFKNLIVENDLVNFYTWKYIYNGGGVAIGDLNNDSLPEIYFTSNMFGNKLYLNLGDMKFKDITKQAGMEAASGYKTGVTMVDINQDGFLDVYVSRAALPKEELRNNLVYINNGDLTFTESGAEYGLNDKSHSTQAYFLDYDLDNDLDIFLVNTPVDFDAAMFTRLQKNRGKIERLTGSLTNFTRDHFYENEGEGKYTEKAVEVGINNHAFGLSASISDLNNDGYPDIFVGNDFVEPDFMLLNNGKGTFEESINKYFNVYSQNSMGSDFADINNDGMDDLMVLDMLPEPHDRKKLLATSMNTDRYESLLKYGYGPQLMRNTLQLNTGNSVFSEIAYFAGVAETDWSWSVLMQDVDADGWKDIVITNGIRRDMTNMDYVNFKIDSIESARKVGKEAIDLKNYKEWISIMPSVPISNYIYKNLENAQFANMSKAWGFDDPGFSNGMAIADLDGDGDLDIVMNNMDDFASIYENTLNEKANYLKIEFDGPKGNIDGIGAKVNVYNSGEIQTATVQTSRGFLSSSPHQLYFGLGENSTVDSIKVFWPDKKVQTVSNISKNQLLTFNYREANTVIRQKEHDGDSSFLNKFQAVQFRHREDEVDDFNRQPLMPFKQSMDGPALATAASSSGESYLYVGGAAGQFGQLYNVNENGEYSEVIIDMPKADKFCEDTDALFFDFNNDGALDLYVVSGGNSHEKRSIYFQDRLYKNDGQGNFSKAESTIPKLPISGSTVSVGDFNRDGFSDLFLGSKHSPGEFPSSDGNYILFNNGVTFEILNAKWTDEIKDLGMVSDGIWTDINQDGYDDLLLVGHFMPVSLFINEEGKSMKSFNESETLNNSAGLWNKILEADINDDGQPEYFLANFGLNTLFKDPKERPLKLINNDFDDNGKNESIITFSENGNWYPIARKEVLSKVLPMINKEFSSYEKYSQATIDDLLPSNKIKGADSYYLNYLESSILSFNTSMEFKLDPLPAQLQYAPVFAIESIDINLDGIQDYIFAGNFLHAEVEHGPYLAGTGYVLEGNNSFNLTTMDPNVSGFLMDKEVRNMRVLRSGNSDILHVACNNDSLYSYKLQYPVLPLNVAKK